MSREISEGIITVIPWAYPSNCMKVGYISIYHAVPTTFLTSATYYLEVHLFNNYNYGTDSVTLRMCKISVITTEVTWTNNNKFIMNIRFAVMRYSKYGTTSIVDNFLPSRSSGCCVANNNYFLCRISSG